MEEHGNIKKMLSNNDAIMTLQIKNLNNSKIDIDKLKEKVERLKGDLKEKVVDL